MINWDGLKDKYGISPETFYNSQHLASQLVYGQMTDLVFASKEAQLERGEWIRSSSSHSPFNCYFHSGTVT